MDLEHVVLAPVAQQLAIHADGELGRVSWVRCNDHDLRGLGGHWLSLGAVSTCPGCRRRGSVMPLATASSRQYAGLR